MAGSTPRFAIRATPDEHWRNLIAHDYDLKWDYKWTSPSRSWWDNGALLVDSDGAALIDADGVRHQLPVPAGGGKLIKAGEPVLNTAAGAPASLYTLFIADEQDRPLVRLPLTGFDDSALGAFAGAAGLSFEVRDFPLGRMKKVYPGLNKSSTLASADRSSTRSQGSIRSRLFGRDRARTPGAAEADPPAGNPPGGPGLGGTQGPPAGGGAGMGRRSGGAPGGAPGGPAGDTALFATARSTSQAAAAALNALMEAERAGRPTQSLRAASEAAARAARAASDALAAAQSSSDQTRVPEMGAPGPGNRPAEYSVELVLHAAVARFGGEPLPYLVAAHDQDPSPPAWYLQALEQASARAEVHEIDIRIETGGDWSLARCLLSAQRRLPSSDGAGRGYRIRAAFRSSGGRPRLVAVMDEQAAAAAGVDIAAQPADVSLPRWWADAVAGEDVRECILVAARENWRKAVDSPRPASVSTFLV